MERIKARKSNKTLQSKKKKSIADTDRRRNGGLIYTEAREGVKKKKTEKRKGIKIERAINPLALIMEALEIERDAETFNRYTLKAEEGVQKIGRN